MIYRTLTADEINILRNNNCWAEDWERVTVTERFFPNFMHRVMLYGDVQIGAFEKVVEITEGFFKHTGINDATLRNVRIGDNCLIEKIGNYINNVSIGDDCIITNVSTIETKGQPTYGEGNVISILNEAGDGNVILFKDLSSQLAAFMVNNLIDKDLKKQLYHLVIQHIANTKPSRGIIGNAVKIINTKEITNCVIEDGCTIDGASRLYECTIQTSAQSKVHIGTGVICERSIITEGSIVDNSVKMQDCFIGEACHISNGFTAAQSVFFANSYMSNGEACAAFCGPFCASHHKSSLLIGASFSFYNAGSATNFSNHAYKMGPIHWGILERGTKTASGAYLLMPAHIGTFSVCFGKLMHHPDTRDIPFSYLMAHGDTMYLVPGRNITTVGLYRDIKKWEKRDARLPESEKSIINFDWLSPYSVGEIIRGKSILEKLRNASGDNVSIYNYHEYVINASSLRKGIKYYDIALRIYMGAVLKRARKRKNGLQAPINDVGHGNWHDLSGLLLPVTEENRLLEDIKNGTLTTIDAIHARLKDIDNHYREYQWSWTYNMILEYYGLASISEEDAERIHQDYILARRAWVAEIRKDAQKEYELGDVEESIYQHFLTQLDHEIDYEN